MNYTKLEYILRQLSKTNKKNYENYIITRIYNKLDDLDIKFITQQYVSRENGSYALTDMYFPQFDIHLEIDEGHHKVNIEADKLRDEEIINITNHEIIRIDATGNINSIHKQIDDIVELLKRRKNELVDEFVPWNLENEYNPDTYIRRGYIRVEDNVKFLKCIDACKCFGLYYKGYQKGGANHPIENDTLIWFPKIFLNNKYSNILSVDENIIYERNNNREFSEEEIIALCNSPKLKKIRIVFAKIKGALGEIEYKFKGRYVLDYNESVENRCFVWKRKSNIVKTYNYSK